MVANGHRHAVAPSRLRELLRRFGLEMERAEEVPSANNEVHRVTTTTGVVAVRVHRPRARTLEQITLETRFLEEIERVGTVSAPKLVRTLAGEPTTRVHMDGVDRVVTVLQWLPGTVRRPGAGAGPATVRRIGQAMGLVHVISSAWAGSASAPSIEPDDLIVPLLPTVGPPRHRALIEAAIEAANALYRDIPNDPTYRGVVHNDVIFSNCVHRGTSTALIDFDDCGTAPYVQDLGAMLENVAGRRNTPQLREALLEGYASVRRLPTDDETALDAVTALRHAWTTAWSYDRAASGDFSQARIEAIARYRMHELEQLLRRL